jgi:pimeloyl-ACP methyl ester carboxylesterase
VAHTLPYDARIMNGFDVPTDRFAGIRVPVFVAVGEKTTPALKAGAHAAAQAIPKAQHRILPKQNHGIKPAAAASALAEAFKAQAPLLQVA